MLSPILQELIESFSLIQGIGKKTATRISVYLLKNDLNMKKALRLKNSLAGALDKIKKCIKCQIISELSICHICSNPSRITSRRICIVENINDFLNIESSHIYQGQYFILYGCISPMEGIGVRELNVHILKKLVEDNSIEEVIMALPLSHAGFATTYEISHILKPYVKSITKLRCGLPFGGDIEYSDQNTLLHAFKERLEVKEDD